MFGFWIFTGYKIPHFFAVKHCLVTSKNANKLLVSPHGEIAPGVDKMVILLADEPNIRVTERNSLGFIQVNRYETNIKSIFAIGD